MNIDNTQKQFSDLFSAPDKATAERIAKSTIFDLNKMRDAHLAAAKLGYKHIIYQENYQPEIDVPALMEQIAAGSQTDADEDAKKKASNASNRIDHIFLQERKLVVFHLFQRNENEWHFFYFSKNDYIGAHFNGPHIHYTSYLWGHDLDDIQNKIKNRHFTFSGVHIKIIPLKQEQ